MKDPHKRFLWRWRIKQQQ